MSDAVFGDFSPAVHRDLFGLLLGEKLGEGVARRVYVNNLDATRVVKIEDTARSFQNIAEWELWQTVKEGPLARWFAPCYHISPCGVVLVQERVADVAAFPASIPAFFTDLKAENFGRRGRQFVARDYGSLLGRFVHLTTRTRVPMRRLRGTDADGKAKT